MIKGIIFDLDGGNKSLIKKASILMKKSTIALEVFPEWIL